MRFAHMEICRRFFVASASTLAAALCTVHVSAQQAATQVTATYEHGELALRIAYPALHVGTGTLTAEVLAPEGDVLGSATRKLGVDNQTGAWQLSITPEKQIAYDEIPWHRVHYKFVYDGDGKPAIEDVQSISEILRRPVVRILGQSEFIAGSRAAIRILVADDKTGASESGTLRVNLEGAGDKPLRLFSGRLNRRGTMEAAFVLPAGLTGSFALHFVAETPIGSVEFTQPITLKEKTSILLTTEKPIYQPGQTIHVRALALDRATNHAADARKLTFEVEDSRGNKVFRKATETDKFGIASAEFTLAEEVNLGAYHLRALMGDPQAPANTAEITLNVERYVLPKFKVAIEFANDKSRHGYRPGDHVTGTVRANYFFGKAVDHAEVTVKASNMDVEVVQAAINSGKTDADGVYHFDLKLPNYFAGRPLSQGAARVLVEATVKDTAAHSETHGEPITVSESPLLVTAIPEGGTLVPGVENDIFILTTYADGTPARTTVTVHPSFVLDRIPLGGEKSLKAQKLETDDAGVAVFHMRPERVVAPDIPTLPVEADDHHGSCAQVSVPLEIRRDTDQVLLHANRAIFKAGDRIELDVLSTRVHGAAYVDVVKNGQTILTRDVDLENGQGRLTLDATPEMTGTLDVDAYLIGRNSQPVADHRLIFVQPAEELKIETTTDAADYRPGGEARIQFHVTTVQGEGVQAAIGLQVVDEAVFALAEQQPGFAKVFFYLEQEAMKPRYEIHSLSMATAVSAEDDKNDQLAARALFSATEMAHPAKLDVEFGRELPQEKYSDYVERYRTEFLDRLGLLARQLSNQIKPHEKDAHIEAAFAALEPGEPRDAWNTPLRIERIRWYRNTDRYFQISSAGPDRKFGTADDLSAFIEVRSGMVANEPGGGGTLGLRMEHDRGPMNQFGEVTGTVTDVSGGVIPNAQVVLHSRQGGEKRATQTDAAGQFDFAGLQPGRYEIKLTARGFQAVAGTLTLAPRDRAVISAALAVGAETLTVTVSATEEMTPVEGGAHVDVLSAKDIDTLAVEGRDTRELLRALPGAVMDANAPMNALHEGGLKKSYRAAVDGNEAKAPQAGNAPHVRSYFPEALYINPEIVTDGDGNASVTIPVADSITTWRMAMLASTQSGALGSGESSLKVFQDFFVDLDLPVTLTQGDRVSIPVAVYNYSGKKGEVSLKLQPEDWFDLENDIANKSVSVDSSRVGGSQFNLIAKRIGKFKLTLTAHMDGGRAGEDRDDIVVREIEVVPNGREQNLILNGNLDGSTKQELRFPEDAIPDTTSIVVRVYPGPLSQVIEGMDSILQMPSGCFEQTSSSTYPNVLALDYMKRTKTLTPEIRAKAEGFIATGYQRLLTFEVPGGGFSWFGQAPANKILTAYGLMEFSDMAKVSDVDQRLIDRTRDWLISQQQANGSWKPDMSFINEGATNRYNSDVLRITAYITWALVNTGYQGAAIDHARAYIDAHSDGMTDAYTLAVVANFAVDSDSDREFARRAMEALLDARKEEGNQIHWTAEETGMYATGESAAVETTGLATQALLKWGQAPAVARKALTYLYAKKGAAGNWGSTQATILALRALLLATSLSASDVHGTLAITIDDKPVQSLDLNADNNDLFHQFVFKGIDPVRAAEVELKLDGAGSLAYQIVGRSFVPWKEEPKAGPLSIDVAYDHTQLAQNDLAKATVTVRNNLRQTANMVMVDLGIPPGFELLTEDLQDFQEKSAKSENGRLEKFSLTATQAILYFNSLGPEQTVTLTYRLRAKYPIRAHTFASRVYEYYDPDVSATAQPIKLEVTERK